MTNGCIAFGNISKWSGVYIHQAAPTQVGKQIVELTQLKEIKPLVLSHPFGFYQFPDDGLENHEIDLEICPMVFRDTCNPNDVGWIWLVDDVVEYTLSILAAYTIRSTGKTPDGVEYVTKSLVDGQWYWATCSPNGVSTKFHKLIQTISLDSNPDDIDWLAIESTKLSL